MKMNKFENKKIQETKFHAIPRFPAGITSGIICGPFGDLLRSTSGIICGSGSFAVHLGIIFGPHRGSFAVRDHLRSTSGIICGPFGDHLRSTSGIICGSGSFAVHLGIIFGLGIICGWGSFAALYSVVGHDRKRARKKRGRTSPSSFFFFFISLSLFPVPNYREPGTGYVVQHYG